MFETERQIRFLYPPIFFAASLLLGVRLDPGIDIREFAYNILSQPVADKLQNADWGSVAATMAVAGGFVCLLGAGYLISCVSVAVLRISSDSWIAARVRKSFIRRWWWRESYEAFVFGHTEKQSLRTYLKLPKNSVGQRDDLFLSAVLDHEVIAKPVHEWVFRRWSYFYLAANSATALVLSLATGFVLGVQDLAWTGYSVAGISVLVYLAIGGWRDSMDMLDFEAHRGRVQNQESTQ
jgi:hypothetical protein